jgi:hypothetical protein
LPYDECHCATAQWILLKKNKNFAFIFLAEFLAIKHQQSSRYLQNSFFYSTTTTIKENQGLNGSINQE